MKNRKFTNRNGNRYAIIKDIEESGTGRTIALLMKLTDGGSRFVIAIGLSFENKVWDAGYYYDNDIETALTIIDTWDDDQNSFLI